MKSRHFLWVLAALALVTAPLVPGNLLLVLLTFGAIAAIAALGLNITFGLCGQLTMFHAAAFGLGGYATVLSMRHLELGFLAAMSLATLIVMALSTLIGVVCFRFKLKDFYFAVTTMAASEMLRLVMLNWHSLTNGSLGITIAEQPALSVPGMGSWSLQSPAAWYFACLATLGLAVVVYRLVANSWLGQSFASIRINDDLAEALGINSLRYKTLGFVVGAAFASVAGALYVFFLGFADPSILSVEQMLSFIAMVLLGGRTKTIGPLLGAFLLTGLPHVIHMGAELRAMTYGGILIVVILLLPNGLTRLMPRPQGDSRA
ncbi:MAG: branched-chain amino acid ABC transporter permease [Pseudomonadota bacterium]